MSSIVKVDTIQENTSANGITVDGLNIKDSKLVTANSVVTANITDANVTLAKLAGDSVDATKIADNAISEEHLDVTSITGHTAETSIADGDTILIHDASASALRKMTKANFVSGIGGTNTPAFSVRMASNQAISANTLTLINFDTEYYDTASAYNTSNKRFTVPSGQAGKYHFTARIGINSNVTTDATSQQLSIELYHFNSSDGEQKYARGRTSLTQVVNPTVSVSTDVDMAEGDYIVAKVHIAADFTINGGYAYSRWSGFKLIE